MRARPAHLAETRGRRCRAPTSQNPPSLAGPKTMSCRPSSAKASAMCARRQGRDVAADQHRRAGRARGQRPAHALAEIARCLAAIAAEPVAASRDRASPPAATASAGRGQAGAEQRASISRSKRSAATAPISRASRLLPPPSRGAGRRGSGCGAHRSPSRRKPGPIVASRTAEDGPRPRRGTRRALRK